MRNKLNPLVTDGQLISANQLAGFLPWVKKVNANTNLLFEVLIFHYAINIFYLMVRNTVLKSDNYINLT